MKRPRRPAATGAQPEKQNAPEYPVLGGIFNISLTMSYFHTGTRTIIGAESFHCPVRDGKEWDQLAMVVKLKLFLPWLWPEQLTRRVEFFSSACALHTH